MGRSSRFILTLFVTTLHLVTSTNIYLNGTEIGNKLHPEEFENLTEIGSNRPKRHGFLTNSLQGSQGSGPGSVEGLLASCQLTNLLLYQLLQQQAPNPGLLQLSPTFQQPPQPFPAAAGLVNNFIFPQRLTTYVTTSTFTVQTTSSTVITIPLLFGNKPSPTTITRTKIFDITTSEIQTITTTIEPSSTVTPTTATMLIEPTKTLAPSVQSQFTVPVFSDREIENDIDFKNLEPSSSYSPQQPNPVEEQQLVPPENSFRPRRKNSQVTSPPPPPLLPKHGRIAVRKVLKENLGSTTENNIDRTPAFRYGAESYNTKKFKASPREFKQSPRDYSSREKYFDAERKQLKETVNQTPRQEEEDAQSYYTRRLKRLGEVDLDEHDQQPGMTLNREFLLDPSFSTDLSPTIQNELKCPTPIEITITKTITKFVNPTTPVPLVVAEALAPTRQWAPPPDSRLRNARKFQPTKAYSSFFQVSEPPPEVSTPSTRGPRRMRGRENSVSAEKTSTVPVQTDAAPGPRSRGRGDILNRARNTPATPSRLDATAQSSETSKVEDSNSGRGNQRRRRQRRPSSE